MTLAAGVGDRVAETRASANLGNVDFRLGRYDDAARWHGRALDDAVTAHRFWREALARYIQLGSPAAAEVRARLAAAG